MLAALGAIIEAIETAGDTGLPSGHLYAHLMPTGITLDGYNKMESMLIASGRIVKRGDVLYYQKSC